MPTKKPSFHGPFVPPQPPITPRDLGYRTYAFQCFKKEFSLLGRLHWHLAYSEAHANQLIGATLATGANTLLRDALAPAHFPMDQLHITAGEFMSESPGIIAHLRTLLLVKGSACMEEYLHQYARYCATYLGFGTDRPDAISTAGEALIRPALVSNIHDSLLYLAELMRVTLKPVAMDRVREVYQIRCAAAHNGGIVDQETARKLPRYRKHLGQRLNIVWKDLQGYLEAIELAVQDVEASIPPRDRRSIEAWWLIASLLASDKTLTSKTVRKQLTKQYGYFAGIPESREIARRFGLSHR